MCCVPCGVFLSLPIVLCILAIRFVSFSCSFGFLAMVLRPAFGPWLLYELFLSVLWSLPVSLLRLSDFGPCMFALSWLSSSPHSLLFVTSTIHSWLPPSVLFVVRCVFVCGRKFNSFYLDPLHSLEGIATAAVFHLGVSLMVGTVDNMSAITSV